MEGSVPQDVQSLFCLGLECSAGLISYMKAIRLELESGYAQNSSDLYQCAVSSFL